MKLWLTVLETLLFLALVGCGGGAVSTGAGRFLVFLVVLVLGTVGIAVGSVGGGRFGPEPTNEAKSTLDT